MGFCNRRQLRDAVTRMRRSSCNVACVNISDSTLNFEGCGELVRYMARIMMQLVIIILYKFLLVWRP
jgi:hypothetical protein